MINLEGSGRLPLPLSALKKLIIENRDCSISPDPTG
jgi:hypothetical protein